EEDASGTMAKQAAVDAVGQILEHAAQAVVQQIPEILQEKLAADQFHKLFLLFDYFAIFFFDTAQGVEVLGMNDLAKDTGIEETTLVDASDLAREAFHQT